MDLDLWEDSKSSVTQIRPGDVLLDDRESSGFLSDRLIGIGSSFLTRSPENGLYILSKCILKNKVLLEIQLDLFDLFNSANFCPTSKSVNASSL